MGRGHAFGTKLEVFFLVFVVFFLVIIVVGTSRRQPKKGERPQIQGKLSGNGRA
jgi:hypothetical protein